MLRQDADTVRHLIDAQKLKASTVSEILGPNGLLPRGRGRPPNVLVRVEDVRRLRENRLGALGAVESGADGRNHVALLEATIERLAQQANRVDQLKAENAQLKVQIASLEEVLHQSIIIDTARIEQVQQLLPRRNRHT